MITRRHFLWKGLAVSPLLLAACARGAEAPGPDPSPSAVSLAPSQASGNGQLPPTPACGEGDELTPAQTEGPYFKPSSPQRTSLRDAGSAGTLLVVTGTVLTRACRSVSRTLVDFWQADDRGQYDNQGFGFRGHQFTDEAGRFRLETVVPGLYPGRTRHIHVKVQAPNQRVLTTQLYFPGEPGNRTDGIFNQALVMEVRDGQGGKNASFDFVLDLA